MASVLNGAKRWVRRAQYLTGLKQGRLAQIAARKDAPYRAVVLGLPEAEWAGFDAAFPEYEKLFAFADVSLEELRLVLGDGKTALLAQSQTSRRLLQRVTAGMTVPVFLYDAAAVPLLVRKGQIARGYSIDLMDSWATPRRANGTTIFLENFDLSARPKLLAAAQHLLRKDQAVPKKRSGRDLLLLPYAPDAPDGPRHQTALADLKVAALSHDAKARLTEFPVLDAAEWSLPETVLGFITALAASRAVVTRDHPLGLLAALMGYEVITTGPAQWAGFGLTTDLLTISRKRRLSAVDYVAMTVFLLSRYVDPSDALIDPADDWHLPGEGDFDILDPTAAAPEPRADAAV